MATDNLVQRLRETAEHHPDHPAQRYWDGTAWRDRTYHQLWDAVQGIARGLKALGIMPGDRVGLLARTRPEWIIADLAIWCCDAVTVPIYPSIPADQVHYIVEDSGAEWVIAENEALAVKAPHSDRVILIEPGPSESRSFLSLSLDGPPMLPSRGRDDLATLVYTSGTTGLLKGVMLTHGNILSNIEDIALTMSRDSGAEVTPDDVALSFLPLSHILERTTHHFFLGEGAVVAYARSTDDLPDDLLAIRPTLMVSVPRVFEKIYARVQAQVGSYSAFQQRIFRAGVRIGEARYQYFQQGRPVPTWIQQQHRLYDRLVYQKIRQAVGGRLRMVISGGAPLAPEIGLFFFAMGVPVLEGYGLTETAPVLAVNVLPVPRYGTVGRPLSRVQIAIAEDGEILARGPNVTAGYWNLPEDTKEAFQDGWFHTGDVGTLTPDGFLKVTDRKKYLIVLSTGKNVAPQAVEQKLTLSPLIEQAVVLGNRRKFISALLYLDPALVQEWARLNGKANGDYATLLKDPALMAHAMGEVERVSSDLAPFERPKKVRFIPEPLAQETGELTASLKVKLPVVEAKYRQLIDSIYHEGEVPAAAAGSATPGSTHWMPRTLLAVVAGVVLALVIRFVIG